MKEEGNQAAAKQTFGFTRAYSEKIRSCEAAFRRSLRIFEMKEEGNQAAAKQTFGFTRAYSDKT